MFASGNGHVSKTVNDRTEDPTVWEEYQLGQATRRHGVSTGELLVLEPKLRSRVEAEAEGLSSEDSRKFINRHW